MQWNYVVIVILLVILVSMIPAYYLIRLLWDKVYRPILERRRLRLLERRKAREEAKLLKQQNAAVANA